MSEIKTKAKSAARECNLDLLRIVSMLMIIFLHSIDHSGVLEAVKPGTVMYVWVMFTFALVKVCVNCYVLISGYFLVKSRFKLEKLFALWMEVVFYSFTIKLLFMAIGAEAFSITSLVSCFVPVVTGRYWFITIYFGLYILAPFLNVAINAMDKMSHGILNIVLFGLFSVLISLHPSFKGMNTGRGWGLAWFVVLYFMAAWLRLYYKPNYKKGLWLLLFFAMAMCMSVPYILGKTLGIGMVVSLADNWYGYDSIPVYVASIAIFMFFLNVKFKEDKFSSFIQKVIVFVSPLTFGVYLIHAHANVSPWSWEFLPLAQYVDKAWFPMAQIGAVLFIFVACAAIDWIRKLIFTPIEKSKPVVGGCNKVMGLLEKEVGRIIHE